MIIPPSFLNLVLLYIIELGLDIMPLKEASKKVILTKMHLNFSFTRPIFCFTAKLSILNSGLIFKKWSYITTLTIFDLTILLAISNFNSLMYLNISCEVI